MIRGAALAPWLVVAAVVQLTSTGCDVVVRDGYRPARREVAVSGPRLILIAGTDVYYSQDDADDVFYYDSMWYTYRQDGWYRSARYGGSWNVVQQGRLPERFIQVPPEQFKHHYDEYHPAHAQYPDLDHWAPRNGGGRGQGQGNGNGNGNGNGQGQGRDQGDQGRKNGDQGRGRD